MKQTQAQRQQANNQQLQEIYEQNQLMKKLGNSTGFFQCYFKELGEIIGDRQKHRTNVEAFNYVNDLYFDLFGEYKYSGYNSFRHQLNRYHKK